MIASLGAIAAGGVAAGVYQTSSASACAFIAQHSRAHVLVCEGAEQAHKYLADGGTALAGVARVVLYRDSAEARRLVATDRRVVMWAVRAAAVAGGRPIAAPPL